MENFLTVLLYWWHFFLGGGGNTLVNYELPCRFFAIRRLVAPTFFQFCLEYIPLRIYLFWCGNYILHHFFNLSGFINAFGLVYFYGPNQMQDFSPVQQHTCIYICSLVQACGIFIYRCVNTFMYIMCVWFVDKHMHIFYDLMCKNVNLHMYQ